MISIAACLSQPTLSETTNGTLFVDKWLPATISRLEWPMPLLGRGTCDTENWALSPVCTYVSYHQMHGLVFSIVDRGINTMKVKYQTVAWGIL